MNARRALTLAPLQIAQALVGLGAIAALMIGATALMATIAFGGQRFFEWQIEESRKISR